MKNKTIGIYLITERATRRDVYVGQGIVYDRWKKHRSKYPEDRFDYRILLECPRCDLNFWEQHYIRVLKTHWTEGGENQNWGGQFWPRPEEPLSPATRAKISASKKGSVSPNKGKTRSEEARAKQTEAMKGKVFSEEHKAKLRGKTPANKGKPMSEEQKAKQSAAMKGRVRGPMSEEQKAKQSAAQKGRVRGPMSEEQKAKLRGKGRPKSEEQKAKIAATLKARAALKRAAKAMAPVDELLGPDCPSATTDNLTQ
jgi:uncharacterized C2H2 Zn-finger protein